MRIAAFLSFARLSIAGFLLLGAIAFGQDADWTRSIRAGDAAMAQHEYSAAEGSYREALGIAEKHWKKDARISTALIKLAESCNAQSKKADAELLANRAVVSMEEARKAHKPKKAEDEFYQADVSAVLFDKVGDIFAANQKYADAEVAYKQVIATREKYALGNRPDHPNDEDFIRFLVQNTTNAQAKIADANDKLANLYFSEQKFQDAQSLYEKSEAIREKQYGPDQPEVAMSLANLAACYAKQSQYEKAEPLYKRVIAILERSQYKDDPRLAMVLENYALLLKKTAREAEAKDMIERARVIRAKQATVSH